jgi:hypothetical protein
MNFLANYSITRLEKLIVACDRAMADMPEGSKDWRATRAERTLYAVELSNRGR